ncbi:Histone-fold [Penicillium brevicompactum]|uniref:Histone-fold n=1 Tax=Penicillium brevicompactum TaxID=5074 RepID=UPI0025405022|nr:Histone-fold [Penicillium brevicompactum]KAJ5336984.1 Histone-fold [Penicillium brevicompactum]
MSTSTPNARGRRSPFTPVGESKLTGLQRLPGHTRYPLTPSRLVTAATPGTQRSASRFTPRSRAAGAPSTPHGLRARQQRAANTPGRDRRRSGRAQRETTFDILRNLGRALAPVSQPIQSSPQEQPEPVEEPLDEFEQLDNEPLVEPPRLSLPIQGSSSGDDETSPEMRPPRMSLALGEDDMDMTYQSVEYPRRETSIRDRERLSMMSRAGRISGDFEETRLESDDAEETGLIVEDEEATMMSGGDFDRGGETEDLGRFHFDLNFPSPVAAPLDDPIDGGDDMEDFALSTADVQPAPVESDDDDVGGDFGFGIDFPPAAASPSESPGLVGGGLRDQEAPTQGKEKKISRHGIPVPNLPAGVVKKLATRFARSKAGSKAKINKATLAAIEQASSWYFEQASQDLAAYSKHAGRKTIDESDVITLLKRQRHINKSTTVFSLAQKHLPKELQQDMRLAMPP